MVPPTCPSGSLWSSRYYLFFHHLRNSRHLVWKFSTAQWKQSSARKSNNLIQQILKWSAIKVNSNHSKWPLNLPRIKIHYLKEFFNGSSIRILVELKCTSNGRRKNAARWPLNKWEVELFVLQTRHVGKRQQTNPSKEFALISTA